MSVVNLVILHVNVVRVVAAVVVEGTVVAAQDTVEARATIGGATVLVHGLQDVEVHLHVVVAHIVGLLLHIVAVKSCLIRMEMVHGIVVAVGAEFQAPEAAAAGEVVV